MKKILCSLITFIVLILIIILYILFVKKKYGFQQNIPIISDNYRRNSWKNYVNNKSKNYVTNTYTKRKINYLNNFEINNKQNLEEIPKQIYMTYHKNVPKKVFINLEKYAVYNNQPIPYTIFNDNDAIKFLSQYYIEAVVNKFKSLSGAHKADLFRYCILYINGGIYMDIKTELIKPLSEIIDLDKKNTFYSVKGSSKVINKQIYQGIIITPPRNEIIFKLIVDIMETPNYIPKQNYFIFVQQFYKIANKYTDIELKLGLNKLTNHLNLYLFEERLEKTCETPDRYGVCANIYDQDNKIIKTRFDDYPW